MATVQISSSFNMHDASTWYGTITAADSTHIVIANGPLVGTYTGNFTYGPSGNVSGTLTGVSETFSGEPMFSATGLDVSASYAEQLIDSDQVQTLLQTALSGDDSFSSLQGLTLSTATEDTIPLLSRMHFPRTR